MKLFLDSNALISAIISPSETTAIKRLVTLGEKHIIDLYISHEVIRDTERFLEEIARERGKNPANSKILISAVITLGNIATTPDPNDNTIDFCEGLIGYRPDARILATAIECNADVLVTRAATHLLGNPKISPPDVSILVLDPKDALDWCFEQWKTQIGAID